MTDSTPLYNCISLRFDYYPFGMVMPGRSYTSSGGDYRFAFNGKEKDSEFTGSPSHLDFGARIYDSRLGRFLSTDPWEYKYAWQTPYAYFSNSPIWRIDYMGMGDEDEISEADVESHANYIKLLQEKQTLIADHIVFLEEQIAELENIIDAGDAGAIGSSLLGIWGVIGAGIYEINIEADGARYRIDDYVEMLQGWIDVYNGVTSELNAAKDNFSQTLAAASTLVLANGVTLNKNNARGSFALYEFVIDGTHYKFGLADAERVTKRDNTVMSPDGKVKTIPAGTPVRIYQQERAALRVYSDVEVYYGTYENTTKKVMKIEEDAAIRKKLSKTGVVGDGNIYHSKKYSAPQIKKFPKKLK